MLRFIPIGILGLAGWLLHASPGQAQVFVRVPFVRVYVGPGGEVSVRAPFVAYSNLDALPPPTAVELPAQAEQAPPRRELPQKKTAAEQDAARAMTLSEFARTFQPGGGTHEVLLINPLTQAATPVHFTLPEGMPRRILMDPQGVEFVYGLRHFVRIHFNSDGVVVTAR